MMGRGLVQEFLRSIKFFHAIEKGYDEHAHSIFFLVSYYSILNYGDLHRT
jgi:uncharacterized protein YktA (UPF0223 family)